ncbi:hypothetical protein Thiowin_04345 [Thiorhodovibrio winogradskyi]|uniref:Outer membrane protein beta-barrel domain-containing protein n=1 Tax=Thiorhodovibrio winogradskyi TaxID=77007 RepID=A0ABZ0SDY3_9GAMM|nr:hypothetical protein [Thiorhodovibrio winogradskyi]
MPSFRPRYRSIPWLTAACLFSVSTAGVAESSNDSGWQFRVTPYLWLPALDANATANPSSLRLPDGSTVGPVSLRASTSPDSYLSNLDMAFMAMGEARKGRWSLYTDVLYTSFGDKDTKVRDVTGPAGFLNSQIERKARIELSATVWTLAGGYQVIDRSDFSLDLMAGARYLSLDSNIKLSVQGPLGRVSRQQDVSIDQDGWDGLVGLRGEILFPGTQWFVPFYADLGTGASNTTWQAMLGIGYRLDWGDVTLAYRALSYDFDKLDADMTLQGPGLGVSFRW